MTCPLKPWWCHEVTWMDGSPFSLLLLCSVPVVGMDSCAPESQFCPTPDSDPAAAAVRSHLEIYFKTNMLQILCSKGMRIPFLCCPYPEVITATHFFFCHVRLLRFPPISQTLLAFFCLPQVHQFPRSFLDNLVSISCRGFNLILCWYLQWPVFPGTASPTPLLVCTSECRHLHGFNPSSVSPFAWIIN